MTVELASYDAEADSAEFQVCNDGSTCAHKSAAVVAVRTRSPPADGKSRVVVASAKRFPAVVWMVSDRETTKLWRKVVRHGADRGFRLSRLPSFPTNTSW